MLRRLPQGRETKVKGRDECWFSGGSNQQQWQQGYTLEVQSPCLIEIERS